jgi:hypothetical protein
MERIKPLLLLRVIVFECLRTKARLRGPFQESVSSFRGSIEQALD